MENGSSNEKKLKINNDSEKKKNSKENE